MAIGGDVLVIEPAKVGKHPLGILFLSGRFDRKMIVYHLGHKKHERGATIPVSWTAYLRLA
jgi:hypothetical protein